MSDEDCLLKVELVAELYHVVRIAIERGIFGRIVGLQVRATRADMIKKDCLKVVFESGGHVPPHVLVAAKSVGEHHCRRAGAGNMHVIAN